MTLQAAKRSGIIQQTARVDSSPAVANGYVYVGCTKVDVTQNDLPSNLYCLDASTGDKVWNFTMNGGASYSSPAIAGDLVYMGDFADNVYCLNATTGTEVWTYTTGAHVDSSPAIADGNVYVGSWDHNVYAFGVQSAGQTISIPIEYILIIAIAITVVIIAIAVFAVRRKVKQK